ncbi:MAG: 30S ribosomal protein S15 [Cyanobacteriota bacterium]
MSISKELVAEVVKEHQVNDKDTGSTEVQIALLTKKIEVLTAHLKVNKKDFSARRGLLQLVGSRRKFMRYLNRKDNISFVALSKKLNLKK